MSTPTEQAYTFFKNFRDKLEQEIKVLLNLDEDESIKDSLQLIDDEKLFSIILLLFPKANIDALKKNAINQFELASLIPLIEKTLIKSSTSQFLNELLGNNNINTLLLDDLPSPLWSYIASISNPITFVSNNLQTQKYFKLLFSDAIIQTTEEFASVDKKFELSIVNIPFIRDSPTNEFETIHLTNSSKPIRVSKAVAHLALGLKHLEKNGTQLVFSIKTQQLINGGLLEVLQSDFKLKGIFQPRDTTFFSNNPLVPEIMYFTHGNSTEIFVGIIADTKEQRQLLFDNFKKNKSTKTVATGKFVKIDQFVSVKNLEAKEKYQIIAKQAGGTLTSIDELTISPKWRRVTNNNFNNLSNLESSVFIPLIGNQPAVTIPASIQGSIQNTVQIILDSNKIKPEYFAQILNQQLGYHLRMNASVGLAQQALKKELFLGSEFPLPTPLEQNKILELSNKLNDAAIQLNSLRTQLWKTPSSHAHILSDYKKKFKEPLPDEWIEVLPYPLASILRLYYAKSEPSKKFECLVLFFEALSEFLSNIFLSSFYTDKEFYKEHCIKLTGYTPEYKNWVLNSSFGGWNNLFSALSKSARTFLSENESKERVQSILGNPSQLFIKSATEKKITEVLNIVCRLRSDWKGHTGITSESLHKERVVVLENHLLTIKEFLINAFDECSFHIAGKMTFNNDAYFKAETKLLKGSHSIFKDKILNVSLPMTEGSIYLLHNNQERPIKLLPLIKLMASPSSADNACYFYNRMDKNNNARLISYHFDGQPETNIEDLELVDALNLLNPSEI
jgi:hypothetical protein